MEKLDANFADFLRSLNRHGVECYPPFASSARNIPNGIRTPSGSVPDEGVQYLVVGGYAVGYHGFVRATGDLDVFVGITPANASNLVAAFHDFGFNVPELTPVVFLEKGRIVRIGVPPLRLEVMNDISGVSFAECYVRRIEETIDGVRINFIDREKLIDNKRSAGRPKDLADIDALTRQASPE